MKFHKTSLDNVYLIEPEPFVDNRGEFYRTFCKDVFNKEINHQKEFVQFNHSRTNIKGTIRGLHFQYPPFAEIKLIRCVIGAVFDVVVDIRMDSPTFLRYEGFVLSEENKKMIYIPEGFAHGFQTLQDKTSLIYHHSNFYKPGNEGGLKYDDPKLNIKWPLPLTEISEKDQKLDYIDNTFKGIKI